MKGINLKEEEWSTVSIAAGKAIKIRPEESPLVDAEWLAKGKC